ncbi:hypothetical protein MSAN_00064900 [Mycena sanguinolenta]|uniref:Uncharacterized protein n=1 Tax=Mycena sanguinolenta TaxID=230812 RepID=A0A8H6ZJ49_9AGAR|nr:hypothetical protein MSAN_00064900 [Mycena sanguinolenta]
MVSSSTLYANGQGVLFYLIGLVVQTFFFGAYTILIWLSTRMLLGRKLNARVNQVMFGITIFMYLLSAAHWMFSVADEVDRMRQYIAEAVDPSLPIPDQTRTGQWYPLFNALTLINYVLSDGVVVWRARIICVENRRKYMWITMGFLAVTSLSVTLTIAFRVANCVIDLSDLSGGHFLPRVLDILQVTTLVMSLLSNLTATGVVGATAWGHWRIMRRTLGSKTSALRTNHILLLIVESGVIYCISAVLVLIFVLIRLPEGTLGDLWTPVQVQFAGAYPCIVLLLVSTKRSLSESSFTDNDVVSSEAIEFSSAVNSDVSKPIHFARNPAISGTDTTVMDIASSHPPTRKFSQPQTLSDDSCV